MPTWCAIADEPAQGPPGLDEVGREEPDDRSFVGVFNAPVHQPLQLASELVRIPDHIGVSDEDGIHVAASDGRESVGLDEVERALRRAQARPQAEDDLEVDDDAQDLLPVTTWPE
jgi:hypothetical protein